MQKKSNRLSGVSGGISTLLASLVCILAGLAVGFLTLLVLGGVTMSQNGEEFNLLNLIKITWEQGFKPIVQGGFYSKANAMGMAVRMEILQAAPLIMTGLSVAFAYKTGLFNIGAAGQYVAGAGAALYCALAWKLPWYVCLLAAIAAGAALGSLFTWKFSILLAVIVLSIVFYRPFCKWLCPLGAFYALFNRVSLFQMKVDKNKCVSCGKCARACKMDVDVTKTPNHTECIRCGMCIRACPTNAVSFRYGFGDGKKEPANELKTEETK